MGRAAGRGAAYTFAPFHMVNVYVRGDSLAEFWAMAFYPLVLLAADWLSDFGFREQWTDYGWHGIAAPVSALFALAYAALILEPQHLRPDLFPVPAALLAASVPFIRRASGIHNSHGTIHTNHSGCHRPPWVWLWPLAAWFFIPALAEKSLAQLGAGDGGYFHFSNHFRGAIWCRGRCCLIMGWMGAMPFGWGWRRR
jgi:hypothetical protein